MLIVANQPTWGLDIGAVAFVHQQLLDACARGAAVLLISDDLDEIFALADRIAVMHAGRLTGARPRGGVEPLGHRPRDGRRERCRGCPCRSRLSMRVSAAFGSRLRMRLESRGQVSRLMLVAAPFAAVAFTLVVAVAVRRVGRRAASGARTR